MANTMKPDTGSKLVEGVAKLIELTQEGNLKWKALPPQSIPLTGQDYERVEGAYEAEYSGRRLHLYKRTYKTLFRRPSTFILAPQNEFYPVRAEEVVLENVDEFGNIVYKFPKLDSLSNLFASVQYQNGGRELLDALLGES